MKIYHSIIFLQGDNAKDAIDILNKKSAKACVDYLSQWDYGHESENIMTTTKEPPWGNRDNLKRRGKYILSYNLQLDYVGLTRIETVNKNYFNKSID